VTTAIELQPQLETLTQRDHHPGHVSNDTDQIIHASRLADNAVPEGGYGWVVVGGCAIIGWWAVGTSYCWGVIQSALVEEGVSSPAVLSFVGSLATAFISALAIVTSRLTRLLGARYVGMTGILLIGLSEILSSFSVHNVGGLFATAGALMGLGMRFVSTLLDLRHMLTLCVVSHSRYVAQKPA